MAAHRCEPTRSWRWPPIHATSCVGWSRVHELAGTNCSIHAPTRTSRPLPTPHAHVAHQNAPFVTRMHLYTTRAPYHVLYMSCSSVLTTRKTRPSLAPFLLLRLPEPSQAPHLPFHVPRPRSPPPYLQPTTSPPFSLHIQSLSIIL